MQKSDGLANKSTIFDNSSKNSLLDIDIPILL